jgi:predicted ATP-binding protein involved in virulence
MVLLDELEVHLHPEWKMNVVSDLRSMFPHLQFVVTTHDPLCLRGLERGEIHLLRRDELDEVVVEQIDVPPGLDADEILTGQWFGLTTTLDRAVESDLLEYQRLRMEGRRPDDPELAPLRQRLSTTIGSYAGTSAGGVLLDAASELAAEQASSGAVRLTKDAVKQRLLDHAQRPRP